MRVLHERIMNVQEKRNLEVLEKDIGLKTGDKMKDVKEDAGISEENQNVLMASLNSS